MKPLLTGLAESNASLWILAASPGLWSAHFLASYAVAAVWCGRLGDGTIASCVVQMFRAGTFPPPQGGCVDAAVPMNFVPKS